MFYGLSVIIKIMSFDIGIVTKLTSTVCSAMILAYVIWTFVDLKVNLDALELIFSDINLL